MARISGEIVIGAPVEVVFDTVADQRNEPRYNPHMVRSEKVTPGPVGAGTRFRSAVRSAGRLAGMDIEYTGYQRPKRLSSVTRMAQAEFSGTLTFEPAGPGTRLRWSWDARFRGPLGLLTPALARVGARQERATWAGLKRYLELPRHDTPAPGAAGESPGERPPGERPPASGGTAGAALLAASAAGTLITPLIVRRFRRGGSLLAAVACGVLCVRDAQLALTGTPAVLRPLPRDLLLAEVAASASATGAALAACRRQQPVTTAAAAVAAAATFALHTVRFAIYLSPGHGRREPAAQ